MAHPSGISDGDLAAIEASLGDAYNIQRSILLGFDAQMVALRLGQTGDYDSTLPVASVCLNDAAESLCETRMALGQSTAYRLGSSLAQDDDTRRGHLFSAHFFWDDVVLRLYATAEDMAAFAHNLFGVTWMKQAKAALRKNNARGLSRFDMLYQVMVSNGAPSAPKFAQKIIAMGAAHEWEDVSRYRNDWTHNQRWRIEGTGLSYARVSRWESGVTTNGATTRTLGLVTGDKTRVITIEKGLDTATKVYGLLRDVVSEGRDALAAML